MTNHYGSPRLQPAFSGVTDRVQSDAPDTGVAELLERIRRHRVALAVWVLAWIGGGIAFLVVTPPEFTASTQIILEPQRSYGGRPSATDDSVQTSLDAAQADGELQVVKSERLLRKVFDTLDLANSPDYATAPPTLLSRLRGSTKAQPRDPASAFLDVMNRVSVRRVGQSYVLEVSYRASSPTVAAHLANSLTAAYIWDQVELKVARAERGNEMLQGRISDLQAEEGKALAAVKAGVIPDSRFPDADARVISAALVPTGKSYPPTSLVLVFAATLGLLSGLAAIVARHGFDQTLRSQRQIAASLNLTTLAVLPRVATSKMRSLFVVNGLSGRDLRFIEGLRAIAAAFMAKPVETRHRAIGVVSWLSGEGKSTVAANLAYLLAGAGQKVSLIDGDLRDPSLTAILAPETERGLCDMLRHQGEADRVEIMPNLTFTPAAGRINAVEPTLFLGSPAMQHFIDARRLEMDVIVDLPAASQSADIRSIALMLDSVILVAEAEQVTIEEITNLVAALSPLTTILGVVLNKARARHWRRLRPRGPAKLKGEPRAGAFS